MEIFGLNNQAIPPTCLLRLVRTCLNCFPEKRSHFWQFKEIWPQTHMKPYSFRACIIELKMVTSFPLHTPRHFGLRSAVSLLYCRLRQKHCSALSLSTQTPLFQMLDSTIHQVKYNYSVDKPVGLSSRYTGRFILQIALSNVWIAKVWSINSYWFCTAVVILDQHPI